MPAGPPDWAFIIRTILFPSVYEKTPAPAPRFSLQLNLRAFIWLIATTPPSLFANKGFVPCWGFWRGRGLGQPLLSLSQICLPSTPRLLWITARCHPASLLPERGLIYPSQPAHSPPTSLPKNKQHQICQSSSCHRSGTVLCETKSWNSWPESRSDRREGKLCLRRKERKIIYKRSFVAWKEAEQHPGLGNVEPLFPASVF